MSLLHFVDRIIDDAKSTQQNLAQLQNSSSNSQNQTSAAQQANQTNAQETQKLLGDYLRRNQQVFKNLQQANQNYYEQLAVRHQQQLNELSQATNANGEQQQPEVQEASAPNAQTAINQSINTQKQTPLFSGGLLFPDRQPDRTHLDMLVAQHLFRENLMQPGQSLAKEAKLPILYNTNSDSGTHNINNSNDDQAIPADKHKDQQSEFALDQSERTKVLGLNQMLADFDSGLYVTALKFAKTMIQKSTTITTNGEVVVGEAGDDVDMQISGEDNNNVGDVSGGNNLDNIDESEMRYLAYQLHKITYLKLVQECINLWKQFIQGQSPSKGDLKVLTSVNCNSTQPLSLQRQFDLKCKEAMEYAQTNLAEYFETTNNQTTGRSARSHGTNYEEEILELVGALTFVQSIAFESNTQYSKFFSPDLKQEIRSLLIRQYCQANQLAPEPILQRLFEAAKVAMPLLSKHRKHLPQCKADDELPCQINLPFNYHEVFVCPVNREPCSFEDNEPMVLPCGHVLCKQALERMSLGARGGKFKCYTCPMQINTKDEAKPIKVSEGLRNKGKNKNNEKEDAFQAIFGIGRSMNNDLRSRMEDID